jgi:hypothetical protein
MNKLLFALTIFLYSHSAAQNSSLSFDNSNTQYVNIPDNNSLDLASSFTIEGWLYPTGPGSNGIEGGMVINKESSYEIARFADGTLQYALSANGLGDDWAWTNTGFIAPLNTWTHFALIKSGTSVTFYMNGVVGSNNTAPATLTPNTGDVRLANRSNAGHFLHGRLEEIRIWNTARTMAQVKDNMFNKNLSLSTSGMVAYYRFDEGSGTVASNSCTNVTGIDGTLVNAPVWVGSPVQFGANALSLDGTNDFMSIPDNNSLDISTAITIEAWVYATKNTGIQNVLCKSSNVVNTGYIFPRTDDGWGTVVAYMHIGGIFRQLTTTYPSLNAWHHLASTYDGTAMKIYIDGVLAASLAITGVITTNNNILSLGSQPGFGELFGGSVDELRIWNVARTQAEIQATMNTELDPETQTGLVSAYTMNQGIAAGNNTGLTTIIDQKGNNHGTATSFDLNGGSSNFVAQKADLLVLPVSWLGFTARKQGETVLLNWSTGNEQGADDYVVQHSTGGTTWTTIGTLPAAGISIREQHYSFQHATPAEGHNYYRIRQKDLNGRISYSKTVTLLFRDQKTSMIIFPNPVSNGKLNIQLQEMAIVSVYNNTGVLIWNKQLTAGAQEIDISKWSKGIYYVKTGQEAVKVVVR